MLDEHERTMAFAEVALGQIKSLRQTAVPRNYEIWYVYATGYNPSAQQDHQRDAGPQRQADRGRSRADLRDLSFPDQDHRPHRQGRRPRHRRDRRRDDADHRRARHVGELRRQPVAAPSKKLAVAKNREPDQGGRRNAGEVHPRDARHQQGAGRPADAVEDRDQQSAAQPRGDPGREPDRSAHRPRQPQIFRPLDRAAPCRPRWPAASRCRC